MKTRNEFILAAGEWDNKLTEAEGRGGCRSRRLRRECNMRTNTGYLDSAITNSQVTLARPASVEKWEEYGSFGIHTILLLFCNYFPYGIVVYYMFYMYIHSSFICISPQAGNNPDVHRWMFEETNSAYPTPWNTNQK